MNEKQSKATPGPWMRADSDKRFIYALDEYDLNIWSAHVTPHNGHSKKEAEAAARLMFAAPDMRDEMVRYLTVIERAEADPETWARLTEGTGIATANGYRAAITKATQGA